MGHFPCNATFQTTDWVTKDYTADKVTYDIAIASILPLPGTSINIDMCICCKFSITKWIHLNHGNEGVTTFFCHIHHMLKPGCAFIMEPQAWETYAKACCMDLKLRKNARHLQLHPEDFPALLEKSGFGSPQHLGIPGKEVCLILCVTYFHC